ncbi:MAG: hypothetical protein WC511_05995 [Candidatus Pacearchaeota archaeon]
MKLEQKLFDVNSLNNLSASALYSGDVPIYTPNGVISSKDVGIYSNSESTPLLPKFSKSDLTVINLPFSGTSLHIHEEAGGITHFKHDKGKNAERYSEINSYDAAMADAGKPAYDAMEIVEKMLKMNPFLKGLFEKDNLEE